MSSDYFFSFNLSANQSKPSSKPVAAVAVQAITLYSWPEICLSSSLFVISSADIAFGKSCLLA